MHDTSAEQRIRTKCRDWAYAEIDYGGRTKRFATTDWSVTREDRKLQGCLSRRLDSLVEDGLTFPDHIMIVVDGLRHRVIACYGDDAA